ncbi:MAG: beta-galactosidase [Anaerolineales bacterium]|nr:beta-galactosidase [Anaerolineales bacterium]
MATFSVARGQFWLDGQPVIIQAGELHYFRIPPDQWRQRLGMLQASGFNAVAAYIPWLWHEPAEGAWDFDGHGHEMADLAGFLDLAAEMGFWIIARPGPYIMAETYNEGIPQWVFDRYPQVAFIDQNGQAQNLVSYLHPDFLACTQRWYEAVFTVLAPRQITRGGRIILVQLDNEMGMAPWVRNLIDTNPDTLTRLAQDLERTYGATLAERYAIRPTAASLRDGLRQPQAPDGARIVEDYRRFYRGYLKTYMTWLWDQARACGLEVPPVVNIHGFGNGGKTFPIGLSQLVDVMALPGMISATDVYPLHVDEGNFNQLLMVNEMTKTLQSRDQALFSIEFQAGGNNDFSGAQASLFDLHSRLCLSSGMRAINHYLFFDGENHPVLSSMKRHDWGHPVRKDGTPRRHFGRYARLSRVINAYGPALALAQPEPVTTIGFAIDHYLTEVNNRLTQDATQALTLRRDVVLFDMISRGLALTHRAFDTRELGVGTLDPAATPHLWVFMARGCSPAIQQRLVDYVAGGGRLLLAGEMCVEDFDHQPCTILRDALGVRQIMPGKMTPSTVITVFGLQAVPVLFFETYTGDFAEVLAIDEAGGVVGFTRELGQGRALVFGSGVAANTLDDLGLVDQMAKRLGCPAPFHLSDWVDVRVSRGVDGSFLFVNNYQDDPVESTIAYAGQALLGGHPVRLPARRGVILPLEWRMSDAIRVHYATGEITSVTDAGGQVVIETEPAEAVLELTVRGYDCAEATVVADGPAGRRFHVQVTAGRLVLQRA